MESQDGFHQKIALKDDYYSVLRAKCKFYYYIFIFLFSKNNTDFYTLFIILNINSQIKNQDY
jgi:hypothetical protein